jgi:hypothetical protein
VARCEARDAEPEGKDVWLASLKSVLSDAVSDRLLTAKVAKGVRVRMYVAPVLREKGFTDAEALAILRRCLEYLPAIRTASDGYGM